MEFIGEKKNRFQWNKKKKEINSEQIQIHKTG